MGQIHALMGCQATQGHKMKNRGLKGPLRGLLFYIGNRLEESRISGKLDVVDRDGVGI